MPLGGPSAAGETDTPMADEDRTVVAAVPLAHRPTSPALDTCTNNTTLTDSSSFSVQEGSGSGPCSKYHPKQRVYAKDAMCGLWYEAVVRRTIYGVHYNKQVQIGLVSNESEIEELLSKDEDPQWHVFVHYQNWNVKWDRWISEDDVMEDNDESKQIANRYAKEHKQLQKEFKNKKGNRKNDGAAFLKAWRQRMDEIEQEMAREKGNDKVAAKATGSGDDALNSQGNQVVSIGAKVKDEETTVVAQQPSIKTAIDTTIDTTSADNASTNNDATSETPAKPTNKPKPKKKKKPSKNVLDNKATIDKEFKLRLRGLESKKCSSTTDYKITLPFSLKKVMVEAWEVITQCQMVANVPAKVTVRQALDKYLQSKLDLLALPTPTNSPRKLSPVKKNNNLSIEIASPPKQGDPQAAQLIVSEEEMQRKKKQEWTDMVEGIAMFFDEALPFRLLYSQELAQFKVVESTLEVPLPDTVTECVMKKNYDAGVPGVGTAPDEAMECDPASPTIVGQTPTEAGNNSNVAIAARDNPPVETADFAESTGKADAASSESAPNQKPPIEAVSIKTPQRKETPLDQSTNATTDASSDVKLGPKTRPMLPSEVYGCEHLLRFFLKVPEVLAEQQSQLLQDESEAGLEALDAFEKETKQVLAKINDLIRFLHKHQSTMFADSYRRLNEPEMREQQKWIRYVERKRKRATEEKPQDSASGNDASAIGATDPVGTSVVPIANSKDTDSMAVKVQKVS